MGRIQHASWQKHGYQRGNPKLWYHFQQAVGLRKFCIKIVGATSKKMYHIKNGLGFLEALLQRSDLEFQQFVLRTKPVALCQSGHILLIMHGMLLLIVISHCRANLAMPNKFCKQY